MIEHTLTRWKTLMLLAGLLMHGHLSEAAAWQATKADSSDSGVPTELEVTRSFLEYSQQTIAANDAEIQRLKRRIELMNQKMRVLKGDLPDFFASTNGDLYFVLRNENGRTVIYQLTKATNYQELIGPMLTPLPATDNQQWDFVLLSDRRRKSDAPPDLIAIDRGRPEGNVVLHVLDGEANFGTTEFSGPTGLPAVDSDWSFDASGEGRGRSRRLFAVHQVAESNRVEGYSLNEGDGYQNPIRFLNANRPRTASTLESWNRRAMHFAVSDFIWIQRIGGTVGNQRTELHILSGQDKYAKLQIRQTPWPPTLNHLWKFDITALGDVYALSSDQGRSTRLSVLSSSESRTAKPERLTVSGLEIAWPPRKKP